MTEKEKRDRGKWYDANNDREIGEEIMRAKDLCFRLNSTLPSAISEREKILSLLIPDRGNDVMILSPFYADYGYRISIGCGSFLNHNAYLMDGGGISIGEHCFFGPDLAIYTALHPLIAEERNKGLEKALPVVIEDDVWIGGRVTILPGVHIGKGAVIGAGSVVTKAIPPFTLAYGNPARCIRGIDERDRILTECP